MTDSAVDPVAAVTIRPPGAPVPTWWDLPRPQRVRLVGCAGYFVVLTLLFIQPLTRLIFYAGRSDLHSHILLVPLIVGYLLFTLRTTNNAAPRRSITGTLIAAAVGSAALATAARPGEGLSLNDELALLTFAYLNFLAAGAFLFLGARRTRAKAFPLAFLIFMVPLPDAAVHWLENASAMASANTAALLFRLSGTPLLHDGTVLALPGVVLEVAQECSGIRSSWVLFITSLLASHLFLQSGWRKLLLVLLVIPLGIVRNAFRILVIGLLSVHVGPHMLDSAIHRRGGPIYFALSLVPLFLVLWWLRRQEQRQVVPLR